MRSVKVEASIRFLSRKDCKVKMKIQLKFEGQSIENLQKDC